jgi:hypothetical protein
VRDATSVKARAKDWNGVLEVDLPTAEARPISGRLSGHQVTEEVNGLALSGRQLFVARDLKRIGKRRRPGIAAIDVETGRTTGWRPGRKISPAGSAEAAVVAYRSG